MEALGRRAVGAAFYETEHRIKGAALYETDHRANRSGALIGMAACAVSGGIMGFIAGFLLGLTF